MGCIGHLIFMVMHVLAVLFGLVGLVITVPLHLIFAVLVSGKK